MMDRRTFLGQAAAAPMVFGLAELFADEKATTSWYDAALERMKETRRYGILLVIPAEAKARETLGNALLARIEGPDAGAHELLCEAIFICVAKPPDGVKGNRILLDPDGKRVASDTVKPTVFATDKGFVKSFRPFLHGPDNKRLRVHAESIRRDAPDEVRNALESLDARAIRDRDRATSTLSRHAEKTMPLLVYTGISALSLEARMRARSVITILYQNSATSTPGPRLPYGTTRLVEAVDSCLPCGRSIIRHPARRFLRFLAK